MEKNLPKKSNNIDLDLLQIDPQSLKRDLQELHSIINKFEDTNDNLGYKLGDMIERLSKKKGKIFWIEVEKDPKPKELLEISREIVKQTNINFISIDNKITDLHNTDKEIFKLLCILAGLSGMTYTRIKDAFEVIDDAKKIIDENCDVTSEQGKRIKQIAQMHLERIIEDKRRYEEIEAFLIKNKEVLDSLEQQFGSPDQHIEKHTANFVNLCTQNKKEIDRDLLAFKDTLAKSYKKKFIIATALAITLSGVISFAINFLL